MSCYLTLAAIRHASLRSASVHLPAGGWPTLQLCTPLCLPGGLLWGSDKPGGGFAYPLQTLQTCPSEPVKGEILSRSFYRAATYQPPNEGNPESCATCVVGF